MVCGCQDILSLLAGVVVQFQIRSHFSFHKLLSLILCLFLVLFFFAVNTLSVKWSGLFTWLHVNGCVHRAQIFLFHMFCRVTAENLLHVPAFFYFSFVCWMMKGQL